MRKFFFWTNGLLSAFHRTLFIAVAVMVIASVIGAQADENSLFSRSNALKAPGYCPKLMVPPECAARLADYEKAYGELQNAINEFYGALDPAFADETWGKQKPQIDAVSADFQKISTALDTLKNKVAAAKANNFAAQLNKTKTARASRASSTSPPI